MIRSFTYAVLLMAVLALGAANVQAQVSITAFPYTYTQNFNNYAGSLASLPGGWSATGSFSARGAGNGSSNSGGIWAYGTGSDYALGALCSGTSSSITYSVSFRNNTALPVTSLTISYNMEQWRYGGGNTNGFTVTQTGIGAAVSALTAGSGTSTTGTPAVTPKTLTLSGLNIAPNATFSLSWSASDGSGSDNGVAIDDFSLTASSSASAPAPVVIADPVNDTACSGAAASFAVTAANAGGYQWQELNSTWTSLSNAAPYSGVTTATLSVSNVAGLNGRRYRCIVTGSPNDTSAAALLTVPAQPSIIAQAVAAAVCPGRDTSMYIRATGAGLAYQWQVDPGTGFINVGNGASYAGAQTDSLRIIAPVAGMGGYQYRCIVTGICGAPLNSTAAVLAVHPLPAAAITPAAGFPFCAGDSIVLNTGTGTGLTYQWTRNGSAIPGASSAIYKDTAGGAYSVLVTNAFGCTQQSAIITAVSVPHSASALPATSTTFCAGDSVLIRANTGAGYTYQWFSNGAPIGGAVARDLYAKVNGSYTVVVTNSIGCRDTSAAVPVIANAAPPAAITLSGPASFCQGDSVKLDAGLTPGLHYQWFNNSQPLANDTAATYTATASGSYSVRVSTGVSCFSFANVIPVTVYQLPVAQLTALGSPVFCQGDSVILGANAGLRYSYQWLRSGSPVPGAAGNTLRVNGSDTYSVRITDSNGCAGVSNSVVTQVNPLPAATLAPAGSIAICAGDSIVLHANTGVRLSYQWYAGSAVISGPAAADHTVRDAGSYTVQVTDSNGCSARSAALALTVNPLPDTTITLSGPSAFCQGGSVLIQAAAGAGLAYQWTINGSGVPGTASSYTANANGVYGVTVINTATNCRSAAAGVPVIVHPLPDSSVTAGAPLVFCDGDSVVLHAASVPGYRYQWIMNAAPLTGANNAAYTALTDGRYSVTVTDTNGCSSASAAMTVTVHPVPSAYITYATPLIFCDGGAVVLTAYYEAGTSYSWLRDGLAQGISTYSNIVSQTGQYVVVQTNRFGCTRASVPVGVTVLPVTIPSITRNGGELATGTFMSYQWFCDNQPVAGGNSQRLPVTRNGGYSVEVVDANGCTGRSAITFFNNVGVPAASTAAAIRIYPNPARNEVHIDAPVPVQAVLQDLQGRILLQEQRAARLDLTPFANGIYLLQLNDADGHALRTERISKTD